MGGQHSMDPRITIKETVPASGPDGIIRGTVGDANHSYHSCISIVDQRVLLTTGFTYMMIRHYVTASVCILKITGYLYAYMGRLCMSTLIYSATHA